MAKKHVAAKSAEVEESGRCESIDKLRARYSKYLEERMSLMRKVRYDESNGRRRSNRLKRLERLDKVLIPRTVAALMTQMM